MKGWYKVGHSSVQELHDLASAQPEPGDTYHRHFLLVMLQDHGTLSTKGAWQLRSPLQAQGRPPQLPLQYPLVSLRCTYPQDCTPSKESHPTSSWHGQQTIAADFQEPSKGQALLTFPVKSLQQYLIV